MKRFVFYWQFFLLVVLSAEAQKKMLVEPPLEFSSRLTINGKYCDNYQLYIQTDGETLDTFFVELSKPIYFYLHTNKVYSLVYKKEGYPDKVVMVYTFVPDRDLQKHDYHFSFTCEMNPAYSTLKDDYHEFPVALIIYDRIAKEFVLSQRYHFEAHSSRE